MLLCNGRIRRAQRLVDSGYREASADLDEEKEFKEKLQNNMRQSLDTPEVVQAFHKIHQQQMLLRDRKGEYANSYSKEQDFCIFMSRIFEISPEEFQYALSHMKEVFPEAESASADAEQFIDFFLKNLKTEFQPYISNYKKPVSLAAHMRMDVVPFKEFLEIKNKIKDYFERHEIENETSKAPEENKSSNLIVNNLTSEELAPEEWDELLSLTTKLADPYSSILKQELLAKEARSGLYAKSNSQEEDYYIFLGNLLKVDATDIASAIQTGGLFHDQTLKGFSDFARYFIEQLKNADEDETFTFLKEFKDFVITKQADIFVEKFHLETEK